MAMLPSIWRPGPGTGDPCVLIPREPPRSEARKRDVDEAVQDESGLAGRPDREAAVLGEPRLLVRASGGGRVNGGGGALRDDHRTLQGVLWMSLVVTFNFASVAESSSGCGVRAVPRS